MVKCQLAYGLEDGLHSTPSCGLTDRALWQKVGRSNRLATTRNLVREDAEVKWHLQKLLEREQHCVRVSYEWCRQPLSSLCKRRETEFHFCCFAHRYDQQHPAVMVNSFTVYRFCMFNESKSESDSWSRIRKQYADGVHKRRPERYGWPKYVRQDPVRTGQDCFTQWCLWASVMAKK